MRWASWGVPVHLVPLSFPPHTPCPVSSSCHVFILLPLARAHVHIGPHLSFTPPLGEGCVCVPLVVTGILLNCFCFPSHQQGGAEHSGDCTQRSYPLVLEAEPDQLCTCLNFKIL